MRSNSGNRDDPSPAHFGAADDGRPGTVRRSASGRIPQWAIDEALEQMDVPSPWRGAPVPGKNVERPASRARTKRSAGARRRGRRSGTVLGVALVVGLYFSPALFERFVLPAVRPYLPGATMPPPGVEAAQSPLGRPPAGTGSRAYSLQPSPDPGQPFVAYDPCRPVHYVVRPDNAPPGSDQLIRQAIAEVSAATGLRFQDDGATSEAPSEHRTTYQDDRYGKRWAPVLIAWSNPEETPGLAGRIAGLGGSGYAQAPGHPLVLVAGQVALDAPTLADAMHRPEGPAHVRAVIMHELGHVVGLDHVADPSQLMNAENSGLTDFAAGDRAGLALLGSGTCVPQL
ncbi:matrixin family metalloprotease [Pseudarthrobacter albicanus]|uniref:matrixin family metalloprotease n=1 Tax=Pseudarthrobacter albicanus TaxID=2823873 RepID=UPI001FECDE0D|nr:matrixin family metalloprotease [Pseudarthrobacter albicanus]